MSRLAADWLAFQMRVRGGANLMPQGTDGTSKRPTHVVSGPKSSSPQLPKPTIKTPSTVKTRESVPPLARPISAQPNTIHNPNPVKRLLPAASVQKAKDRFKNFSLSKFSNGARPSNYILGPKKPAAVQAAQKELIAQQMTALNNNNGTKSGMTLALPDGTIKKYLPSYDAKAGTIEMSDILNLLTKKMKGTEFYSNGNPTLNRLSLQSQVDEIIRSIKQEPKR